VTCIVCGAAIAEGAELYANAWERTLKQSPCCSEPCCKQFNPDKHWIPMVAPALASEADELRLLEVFKQRVKNGDSPSVGLRELLKAGVRTPGLRKVLNEAAASATHLRKTAGELNMIGRVAGWLTGASFGVGVRDKRDPVSLDQALNELDEWERRFPARR
jgi:hypothetical protein